MVNPRYIELDSTYRDRIKWPNPSQFIARLSQSGIKSDPLASNDPILNAFTFLSVDNTSLAPFVGVFAGGTNEFPELSGAASSTDNFYTGALITDTTTTEIRRVTAYNGTTKVVTIDSPFRVAFAVGDGFSIPDPSTVTSVFISSGEIKVGVYVGNIIQDTTNNEFRTITAYDGNTRIATVDPAFGGVNQLYSLRRGIPIDIDTLQVGSTTTNIILSAGSSSVNNFFKGNFIYIPSLNQTRMIIAYNGTSKAVTVSPSFGSAPGAVDYEILQFTRDSEVPLSFNGSITSQSQSVCHEIELLHLVLPNEEITSPGGPGGLVSSLPYVYIEFRNEGSASGSSRSIIYSNNPNSVNALFRVVIGDVNSPTLSNFLKLTGDKMTQTVKFKPNDNMKMSVYLPCGDLLLTGGDDFSPLPPNPEIQISALFGVSRIS